MDSMKITKDRIRNHFEYSWWKYVLFAILAVFGWNLVYTTTAYRPPKDKKLDVYFVTSSIPSEQLDGLREGILVRFAELEDAYCHSIVYTDSDNYYGSIQLTTYMGAQEGDVYILTRERFDTLRQSGTFLPLDEAIADGQLRLGEIDVSGETTTDEYGTVGVFGIPATALYGMMEAFAVDNRDLVLCVPIYSQNQPVAIGFIDWFIETMRAPKPDWLIQREAEQSTVQEPGALSEMPSF